MVKKPLVHFTPPHPQPQYNINYAQVTQQQQLPSTATATSFTQTLTESTTADLSTTNDDVTDRTPQPFVRRPSSSSSGNRGHTKFNHPNGDRNAVKFSLGETGRILSRPSNELVTAAQRPSSATPHHQTASLPSPPPNDLLPPYDKVQIYDDATTQGPPIYSQWKIPSSGLLPPLLHAKLNRANSPSGNQLNDGGASTAKPAKSVPANSVPISALKRPAIGLQPPRFELPSTEAPSVQLFQNSQHNLFRKSNLVQTTPSFPLPTTEPTTTIISLIPAETPAFAQHNHHHKSPTPRSVPPTSSNGGADAVVTNHLHTRDNHYLELKKLLHIPDYTFPLEADTQARGHYVRGDSVNSFLVKIPVGVNDVTGDDGAATAPTTASPTDDDGFGRDDGDDGRRWRHGGHDDSHETSAVVRRECRMSGVSSVVCEGGQL